MLAAQLFWGRAGPTNYQYATACDILILPSFSPLFGAHQLQKKPKHLWVSWSAALYNEISVLIPRVCVGALHTEIHQVLFDLIGNGAQGQIAHSIQKSIDGPRSSCARRLREIAVGDICISIA